MAGSGLVLTGPWKALAVGLKPSHFRMLLEKNVGMATRQNAEAARSAIQGKIKEGMSPGITELSQMHHKGSGKQSDKPLVDQGDLWMSIATEIASPFEAFAGLIKGADKYNIGSVLHDGATIAVTDRMRAYFRYLASESGGQIKPLRPTTNAIVIPPRPFVTEAYTPALSNEFQKRWQMATQQALREIAR